MIFIKKKNVEKFAKTLSSNFLQQPHSDLFFLFCRFHSFSEPSSCVQITGLLIVHGSPTLIVNSGGFPQAPDPGLARIDLNYISCTYVNID